MVWTGDSRGHSCPELNRRGILKECWACLMTTKSTFEKGVINFDTHGENIKVFPVSWDISELSSGFCQKRAPRSTVPCVTAWREKFLPIVRSLRMLCDHHKHKAGPWISEGSVASSALNPGSVSPGYVVIAWPHPVSSLHFNTAESSSLLGGCEH